MNISAEYILENNDYTSRLKVFSNVVLQRKYQVRDSLSPKKWLKTILPVFLYVLVVGIVFSLCGHEVSAKSDTLFQHLNIRSGSNHRKFGIPVYLLVTI